MIDPEAVSEVDSFEDFIALLNTINIHEDLTNSLMQARAQTMNSALGIAVHDEAYRECRRIAIYFQKPTVIGLHLSEDKMYPIVSSTSYVQFKK
jgi:hypothetical protein